jgi:hypothetical protein
MTFTLVEHATPVGEITTTNPEHPASGSEQRTVVAMRFITAPSECIDLTP